MARFRILALLTLTGAMALLRWVWFVPTPESVEAFFGLYLLLRIAGNVLAYFMTVTAGMLLFLSLVAIRPVNGEYVIRRDTVYGKLFKRFAGMSALDTRGYCAAFWRTNMFLMGAALVLIAGLAMAFLLYEKWLVVLAALVGLVLYVIVGLGALHAWVKFREAFPRYVRLAKWTCWCLIVSVGGAIHASFFGVSATLMLLVLIGILVGTFYLFRFLRAHPLKMFRLKTNRELFPRARLPRFKEIAESNFGETLAGIYRGYLCPRIRIE